LHRGRNFFSLWNIVTDKSVGQWWLYFMPNASFLYSELFMRSLCLSFV
jgi:hypothetical protein